MPKKRLVSLASSSSFLEACCACVLAFPVVCGRCSPPQRARVSLGADHRPAGEKAGGRCRPGATQASLRLLHGPLEDILHELPVPSPGAVRRQKKHEDMREPPDCRGWQEHRRKRARASTWLADVFIQRAPTFANLYLVLMRF